MHAFGALAPHNLSYFLKTFESSRQCLPRSCTELRCAALWQYR